MDRLFTLLCRAEAPEEGVISGYAAAYDQPMSRRGGGWNPPGGKGESIARGAFDELLGSDVLATVNHDPNQVLGRTSSGTLKIGSDSHGLSYRVDLPDTRLAHDTWQLVKRGDMRGASFLAALGKYDRTAGGVVHRSFSRLLDVSIVTTPAYDSATAVARNADPDWVRAQLVLARARVRHGRNSNG